MFFLLAKNNKLTPYDSNPDEHCLYAFCDSYELLEEDNIDILIEMLKLTILVKPQEGLLALLYSLKINKLLWLLKLKL